MSLGSNFTNQSPNILKRANGAENIGKGSKTVDDYLNAQKDFISLRLYGATGADNEDIYTPLKAAIDEGQRNVFVPNAIFSVGTGIDCLGAVIYGKGQYTGNGIQNAKLSGISNRKDKSIIETISQPPKINGAVSPKLLFKRSDTSFALFTRNATNNEYIYTLLKQASDSAPAVSVGTNFELMRAQQRFRCNEVLVYRKNYDRESANITLLSNNLDAYFVAGGSTRLDADNSAGNSVDAWYIRQDEFVEYDFDAGYFTGKQYSATFLSTGASSENLEIQINGVAVKNVDLRADSLGTQVKTVFFDVPSKAPNNTFTVKLVNKTTASSATGAYLIGLNMCRLKDYSELPTDYFVAFFQTDNSYVSTNGAGEYAYQDEDSGLYSGSYHGGELSTYLRMVVGGNRFTPASMSGFYIDKAIGVTQRTVINNGTRSTFATQSTLRYDVDGVEDFDCLFTGDGNAKILYTMLFPSSDGFNYVMFPEFTQLSATEDFETIVDDNADIVQYNSNSGHYIRSAFTAFDNSRNQYGGAYIWNRVGTYRKVYYGAIINNPAVVNRLSFRTSREFGRGKY